MVFLCVSRCGENTSLHDIAASREESHGH